MDRILRTIIPEEYARIHKIFPRKLDDDYLYIDATEYDIGMVDDLRRFADRNIKVNIDEEENIINNIQINYRGDDSLETLHMHSESKYNYLLDELIKKCIDSNSSDIHIEPQQGEVRIRFRIDGELETVERISLDEISYLIAVIKIRGGMDIAEKRLPQDGRLTYGEGVDIRVSTIPTISGEKVEMRILNRGDIKREIGCLGFEEDDIEKILNMLRRKGGMILISGSTNSGKSTTMYSLINYLNDSRLNITTIEDPVEYRIDGINQIQVNNKIGVGFNSGLRSILRQDPDVIVLGEMRDEESARLAIRASITGHLVISTIHTKDAVEVVSRLLDMGIEGYLISSALIGVISQRLIKKSILYGIQEIRGRELLYEIFEIDEEVRNIIRNGNKNDRLIRSTAKKNGMRSFEDCVVKKRRHFLGGEN